MSTRSFGALTPSKAPARRSRGVAASEGTFGPGLGITGLGQGPGFVLEGLEVCLVALLRFVSCLLTSNMSPITWALLCLSLACLLQRLGPILRLCSLLCP